MYSPKIKEEQIPGLYRLAKELKKPMTQLVDEAIKLMFRKYKVTYKVSKIEKQRDSRIIHYTFRINRTNSSQEETPAIEKRISPEPSAMVSDRFDALTEQQKIV